MQRVGFTELIGVYPSQIVGGHGCRPCGTPPMNNLKGKIMDIMDIKNMHSDEIKDLKGALEKELQFRKNIGKDIELSRENNGRYHVASMVDKELNSAFRLRETLNKELTTAETMGERIPVREDIREVDKKIKDLKTSRERMADYIDESSLH